MLLVLSMGVTMLDVGHSHKKKKKKMGGRGQEQKKGMKRGKNKNLRPFF